MAAYITVPLKGTNYTAPFLRKLFNQKTNFCRFVYVCSLINAQYFFEYPQQ